ncbi:hypothetical protein [Microcoleus sp. N3A4]|uniref:hypothetical protein n=1 Tax=Microcoleus sp. N3A4 TaxID=3055379 RepID=UPI002FD48302
MSAIAHLARLVIFVYGGLPCPTPTPHKKASHKQAPDRIPRIELTPVLTFLYKTCDRAEATKVDRDWRAKEPESTLIRTYLAVKSKK